MPGFRNHLVLGFLFNSVLFYILFFSGLFALSLPVSSLFWPLLVLVTVVGSLFPDIDHRMSMVRYFFTVLSLIVGIYFVAFDYKLYGIITLCVLLLVWLMKYIPGFGHRGYTHGVVATVVSSVGVWLVFRDWLLGLFWGVAYFSHWFCDKLSTLFKLGGYKND